jgi:flavin reductase (DIM6/NTAB) family NADH-FMN oxidoreductase RutF
VGKQSATRELILQSGAFGLSVLASDQLGISRLFGTRSSRTEDKFEHVGFHPGQTGSPLLDDCVAAFDCRVHVVYDLGTQKLVVGEIVVAEHIRPSAERLVYRESDY